MEWIQSCLQHNTFSKIPQSIHSSFLIQMVCLPRFFCFNVLTFSHYFSFGDRKHVKQKSKRFFPVYFDIYIFSYTRLRHILKTEHRKSSIPKTKPATLTHALPTTLTRHQFCVQLHITYWRYGGQPRCHLKFVSMATDGQLRPIYLQTL